MCLILDQSISQSMVTGSVPIYVYMYTVSCFLNLYIALFLGDVRSKSKADNKGAKAPSEKKAPPPKDTKAAKGKEVGWRRRWGGV